MRAQVWWSEGSLSILGGIIDGSARASLGWLTTEHPASEDGLPVLVADDGRVLRADNLPGTALHPCGEGTTGLWIEELKPAAERAGFVIEWA